MRRAESTSAALGDHLAVSSFAEHGLESAILFALVRLDIFARIGRRERSLDDLCSELNATPDRLGRLLNAAVGLKILESPNGQSFRVTPRYRNVLVDPASVGYLGNWLRTVDYFQGVLCDLDRSATCGGPTHDLERDLFTHPELRLAFTWAMHDYAASRGAELADYLDVSAYTTMLDLGCGPGTYAFEIGKRQPALRLFLLDRPEVLEIARQVQRQYALANEVTYLPMDATAAALPGAYDVVLISNTLHMLGEDASRRLLQRARDIVCPGGCLIVQGQFLDDDHLGPKWPLCVDLLQLCFTPNGRNHSVQETRAWLEAAGFARVDHCAMSIYNTNSFLQAFADGVR